MPSKLSILAQNFATSPGEGAPDPPYAWRVFLTTQTPRKLLYQIKGHGSHSEKNALKPALHRPVLEMIKLFLMNYDNNIHINTQFHWSVVECQLTLTLINQSTGELSWIHSR